jgi:hypothetical protein
VDSDDDGEEPELIDGIDFNVYLTMTLHDLPHRTHLNLSEVEAQAEEFGERILVVKEKVALQRSSRLAEKRRGGGITRGPLVEGESSDEDGTVDDYPLDDAEIGRKYQTTSQAETQCVCVLSNFGAAEWCEARERYLCLQRVVELKARWGNEVNVEEMKRESPEVQACGRWWPFLYKDKDTGV